METLFDINNTSLIENRDSFTERTTLSLHVEEESFVKTRKFLQKAEKVKKRMSVWVVEGPGFENRYTEKVSGVRILPHPKGHCSS